MSEEIRDVYQMRSITSKLTTRAEGDNAKKVIEGCFIVFNKETELWPGAYEVIHPDACNETISNDIRALNNHEHHLVLGRNKKGTLVLRIDAYGVWGVIYVNENDTDAMNLYARVERGDVDQCSFGFNILEEETEWREDGTVKWIIKKIDLHEVSVVTFPQYTETSAQAGVLERKADVDRHKQKQLEQRKHNTKARLNNVKTIS